MKYNFYATDHKPGDGRLSERVELDTNAEILQYYKQMKNYWNCGVNVFECDTNEQVTLKGE